MLPLIPSQALLQVERVRFSDLRLGDVVTYRNSRGQSITHRIFRRMPTGWWPRGDNNHFPDPDYVTAENLIGRVVSIAPLTQRAP